MKASLRSRHPLLLCPTYARICAYLGFVLCNCLCKRINDTRPGVFSRSSTWFVVCPQSFGDFDDIHQNSASRYLHQHCMQHTSPTPCLSSFLSATYKDFRLVSRELHKEDSVGPQLNQFELQAPWRSTTNTSPHRLRSAMNSMMLMSHHHPRLLMAWREAQQVPRTVSHKLGYLLSQVCSMPMPV